jgi:hypothetical protein
MIHVMGFTLNESMEMAKVIGENDKNGLTPCVK